jgi:hypothetical protein
MSRTIQSLVGSLLATALLTACNGEIAAPARDLSPHFSGHAAGGGATGGTATGGGGGATKPACINAISVVGTATEALSGNIFSATYSLASCQSKTHVSLQVFDLATGLSVFAVPDVATNTVFWNVPYTLTSYRVDVIAYTLGLTGTTVATGSTVVSALNALPCTPYVSQKVTTGYWTTYAAVWSTPTVQDCGLGGTVHLTITNLSTGLVEMDLPGLWTSMVDFEGPQVSYSTWYRVKHDLVDRSGNVVTSSSTDVTTPPLK